MAPGAQRVLRLLNTTCPALTFTCTLRGAFAASDAAIRSRPAKVLTYTHTSHIPSPVPSHSTPNDLPLPNESVADLPPKSTSRLGAHA